MSQGFGKRKRRDSEAELVSSSFKCSASTSFHRVSSHLFYVDDGHGQPLLVDTGSWVTIVPRSYAKCTSTSRSTPTVCAANGTRIKTFGWCTFPLEILGVTYSVSAIVADVIHSILGMDFLSGTDLLIDPARRAFVHKSRLSADQVVNSLEVSAPTSTSLLAKFPSLTSTSLGSVTPLMSPLRIDTGDSQPVFSKCRPLHGDKKLAVEAEILKWEADGIIERISSEVEWASPVHAVRKKSGEWRVCGDFRRLNTLTRMDKYPLPSLVSFNAKMAGCSVFSKVDLKRAYHQVPVPRKISTRQRSILRSVCSNFCACHLG